MSTNAPARRGFLRRLATLPLIGGGVTLIGNPTAAAEPVTKDLLDSYDAWLFYERRWLRYERYGRKDTDHSWDHDWAFVPRFYVKDEYQGHGGDLVRPCNPGGRFHGSLDRADQATGRAAVVLAAAGCDWRETGR